MPSAISSPTMTAANCHDAMIESAVMPLFSHGSPERACAWVQIQTVCLPL
jgi:hypothetical protein